MRTIKKSILSLLLAALMLTLAACGQDKPDYEKLKTDIVGIWCDIEGPEYFENAGDPYYQLYEFTGKGTMAYHIISPEIASYYDYEYELRDDILDIGGQMCRVSVEDDVLTMTNNNGDTRFRRMSMEEVCNFGVVYLDEDNYMAQVEYTEAFSRNWPGTPSSDEVAEAYDATEETSESLAS